MISIEITSKLLGEDNWRDKMDWWTASKTPPPRLFLLCNRPWNLWRQNFIVVDAYHVCLICYRFLHHLYTVSLLYTIVISISCSFTSFQVVGCQLSQSTVSPMLNCLLKLESFIIQILYEQDIFIKLCHSCNVCVFISSV